MKHTQKTTGSLMVTVLMLLTILSVTVLSLSLLAGSNLSRASSRIYMLQSQYSSESGIDIAISRLNNNDTAPYGYSSTAGQPGAEVEVVRNGSVFKSTYQIKVEDDSLDANTKIITAIGRSYIPANATTPKYTRSVRVSAKRSSTSGGASLISRNILEVASSVKDIVAKDLFINEYIQMDKNTNVFTVENLTVAGRINVAGDDCSITGGSLKKPDVFTNPTQTKTVLNLAYNNCTNPPGNSSNTDFTVYTNQTIQKVQSTYIPYSYAMSSGYTNAGSCSDFTTGASPRNLPSTLGSKKTHYPNNSASGVDYSASCVGATGTINLGSNTYNLTDHIHVRANLCSKAMSCRPTFVNNTGGMLYVFVEGSLAFEGLTTSGNDPIVFVVYGDTTEASILSSCPIGGSVYLGGVTAQTITAPKAYLISVNGGLCVDKMKAPYLGGVSGKNVYIATQSGNPFYLAFDPSFPASSIPVNLLWRATTYERLQ